MHSAASDDGLVTAIGAKDVEGQIRMQPLVYERGESNMRLLAGLASLNVLRRKPSSGNVTRWEWFARGPSSYEPMIEATDWRTERGEKFFPVI